MNEFIQRGIVAADRQAEQPPPESWCRSERPAQRHVRAVRVTEYV